MTTTTDPTIDAGALREAWTEVHGPPNAAAEELLRHEPELLRARARLHRPCLASRSARSRRSRR